MTKTYRATATAFGTTVLLLVATILPSAGQETMPASKAGILLDHAWTRATPNGADVAGGYLTIENHGTTPDRLIGGSSDFTSSIDVHEMAMKDGVMTMRPVDGGLLVPPGGRVELKPGGYHLMLNGLKHPLKPGEVVKATLMLEKAGPIDVEISVGTIGAMTYPNGAAKPSDAMPSMDHMHMQ